MDVSSQSLAPEDNAPGALEYLAFFVRRPGMMWGDSTNHYHSLCAFIAGIQFSNTNASVREALDHIIPPHFNEFVSTELRIRPMRHWSALIGQKARTPDEASNLLLELRKKYDYSKWSKKAEPKKPDAKKTKAKKGAKKAKKS